VLCLKAPLPSMGRRHAAFSLRASRATSPANSLTIAHRAADRRASPFDGFLGPAAFELTLMIAAVTDGRDNLPPVEALLAYIRMQGADTDIFVNFRGMLSAPFLEASNSRPLGSGASTPFSPPCCSWSAYPMLAPGICGHVAVIAASCDDNAPPSPN